MKKWQEDVDRLHVHIRHSLDNAVERQTAFNTLAMRRIEQIRLKYQNKGWTERLRRREVTIAVRNDRGYLFEGPEEVLA